jgi:EcsC protein family
MSLAKRIGLGMVPRVTEIAPQATGAFVHRALELAIRGVGRLESASEIADRARKARDGDGDAAIRDLIEGHVRMAGAQGFLTNLGGLVTMPVTVPANITGLALIQCRLVAAIVHLRGYDLADRRTRNAILASLLGDEKVLSLIRQKKMPGTPMAIATAPVYDGYLDNVMAGEVASELLAKVAGKRLAAVVGRRVPVVGGLVGAGTDGISTWRIGRYVEREFLPRNRR